MLQRLLLRAWGCLDQLNSRIEHVYHRPETFKSHHLGQFLGQAIVPRWSGPEAWRNHDADLSLGENVAVEALNSSGRCLSE